MGRGVTDMGIGASSAYEAGEWAWISGASSGIGRAVALEFARRGAGVIVSARRTELLKELASEIRESGGKAIAMPVDVTDSEALGKVAKNIGEGPGRLDIVVPCAGIEMPLPFQMMKPRKMEELFSVNVFAAFEMVRAGLKLLKASGKRDDRQACVVFVSSIYGLIGAPAQSGYSASKSALLGGMRSLAAELGPASVRVNAVVPAFVETEMQQRAFAKMSEANRNAIVKRHILGLGQPEDVAAAVCFLASSEARWITGESLTVDGGFRLG